MYVRKNVQIINETQDKLERLDGGFAVNECWKLKKKLFPHSKDPPHAVLDVHGNLITNSVGILDRFKEEFAYRLRNREISEPYSDLMDVKEYLCVLRLEIAKNKDYQPWTIIQLNVALKRLQNNKCRDPHGHINELYKNIGIDGKESLLLMFNQIKKEVLIPGELDLSDVTILYKNKGSRQDVVNWRGIFKLAIVRNILDRLIYLDEKSEVSKNMSEFQVGNQSERNIRDHTFVIHAVINESYNKSIHIDINFYDIKQCFDAIWLKEAINDMYKHGVRNRNLNLLYLGNGKTKMAVETSAGKTDRIELKQLVMQGSVPGGFLTSNQLSIIGNKMFNNGDTYMYMNKIPIPALIMVDDIASITLCNTSQSIASNVKIDNFVQSKKLECQTGTGKCQWIHIGDGKCQSNY